MSTKQIACEERRADNGIFYRMAGRGQPLLLLHGLMVHGGMFDPLVELLGDDFRMIIPDLRGHGKSGELPGPYDVPALAADLPAVLDHAGVNRTAVLGYSHGGPVAQQFTHTNPGRVDKLLLACTYACNASTTRELIEAKIFWLLLTVISPGTFGKLLLRAAKPKPGGEVPLDENQAEWLRTLMAANRGPAMRGAARGMATFDSRPWLGELRVPTLVVGGTHDAGVPRHHFDTLVAGIPGARGRWVDRAGHTLIWTHTREFAEIIRNEWPAAPA